MNIKQKIILSIIILLLILTAVYSDTINTNIIMNVPFTEDSCTPVYDQNWIIFDACQKENQKIDLGKGTLFIESDGNLTLIDSMLLSNQKISCGYSAGNKCIILTDSNINVHQ